ncbi:hypothetical protein MRX96_028824 [Rhipicephalus microplus]
MPLYRPLHWTRQTHFPPPPPPPTLGRIPSYSASQQQQTCRSASYSEDLPPPSPPRSPDSLAYGTAQSSSASFHHFRPQSSASTYDSGSIYEPIVPRPPSQMSGYSSTGSSLYSSYYPGRMGTGHKSSNHRGGPGGRGGPSHRLACAEHGEFRRSRLLWHVLQMRRKGAWRRQWMHCHGPGLSHQVLHVPCVQ